MINLYVNGKKVEFKRWVFPAGEVGVLLPKVHTDNLVRIEVLFPDSEEMFLLFNIFDALQRQGIARKFITLDIPYLPYARQDRVCKEGESFSLSVFCNLLRAVGYFGKIKVQDLHSEVATKLLETFPSVLMQEYQDEAAYALPRFDYLIAPDKGASHKASLHTQVTHTGTLVLYFEKTRTDTGIVYPAITDNLHQGTACVVDDICDGGETFLKLGQMLKATQPDLNLSLYVTHGVFSNYEKFLQLLEIYDTIYTHNLMNQSVKQLVKEI